MPPKTPEHSQSDQCVGISRDNLERGDVMHLARARDGENTAIISEADLLASRRAFVADDHQEDDIWVFGYGSLIWNPIVQHEETKMAIIYGYHRRFCMWTTIGRGSPDCPGLVLGLDKGGATKGMIFRIKADKAADELDILWRREMMADSYKPVWVRAFTDKGPVKALTFAMRRDRPIFAPPMPLSQTADIIAKAVGFVGPCREYLENTNQALMSVGIYDKQMMKLATLVAQSAGETN